MPVVEEEVDISSNGTLLTKSTADYEQTTQPAKNDGPLKKILHRFSKHSGILYYITGNFLHTCGIFSLKLISADMFDVIIIRFLLQTVVFGCFAMYKNYNLFGNKSQRSLISLMIFTGTTTHLSYLSAFYFLPLSDLNAIRYTNICFATVMAVFFLKEKFTKINALALLLAIVGLVLASRPNFLFESLSNAMKQQQINHTLNKTNITDISTSSESTAEKSNFYYFIGVGLALTCAVTKSAQMVTRKMLITTKLPHSVMNLQFTFFGLLAAISYSVIRRLIWKFEPYPIKVMMIAGTAIGCIQLISNTFFAKALKRENVQLISVLGSLEIVYAVVLQYIFF
ncbi:unnamed protein product, partial [Didymodactylos carnosus]